MTTDFRGVLLRTLRMLPVAVSAFTAAHAAHAQAVTSRVTVTNATATRALDTRVVDSIVAAAMKEEKLVGLSVAIVRNGRIELAKGYGSASLSPQVPVDTGTRFSIGSVTKEIVVALALTMQEEGRLSVHDTVAKWYPNLTRSREITLLDLINHVSGYRDYYPLDYVDREMAAPATGEQIALLYGRRPLDFDPGTRWSYSNTGYTILGRVLERVSGKPLGTLLRERIFTPLGMRQSVYEPDTSFARSARGYVSWALGEPEIATPEARGWTGPPGGIWSTASDLARWDLALMRPGFLSATSRKVLFGERMLKDGTPTGYAGGLNVANRGGRTMFSHGGATSGFSSTNVFVPADSAAVVLLSNTDRNSPANDLLRLVSPPRPGAPPPSPTRSQQAMKPPTPAGAPALQASLELFAALQRGTVDRSRLSADYGAFLTPERLASAARTLGPLGEVTAAELQQLSERGGMQVSVAQLTVGGKKVQALMYRAPDGSIEEYLLW
jgi:D-alanyl-D-alanine carboxypeptidase